MSFVKKIRNGFKYIFNPDYRFMIDAEAGKYNTMPDDEYLARLYKSLTRRELNLKKPKRINEKIQWMKLYDKNPLYTILSDKHLVRQYIADTIGEQYLVPSIGYWDRPEDIDFDSLPSAFVLKCNHNSGKGMCICKNKADLNNSIVIERLQEGLQEDYAIKGREWPYKNIERKIVGEVLLEDSLGADELTDYKVMCFNGTPKLIQVHHGRFKHHTIDYYTSDWQRTEVYTHDVPKSDTDTEKPQCLDEMLRLSSKLSEGMPFVRVDWYCVNGRLYFGEMTFYDGSGFDDYIPDKYNELLGSWIDLSIVNQKYTTDV